MGGFWLDGLRPDYTPAPVRTATEVTTSTQVQELAHQVERLSLMNQALWELLRERLGLTDADIERKANEVDLRDGVQDGRMTTTALKCPKCERISSSKHWKCMYCGVLFEKPVMG